MVGYYEQKKEPKKIGSPTAQHARSARKTPKGGYPLITTIGGGKTSKITYISASKSFSSINISKGKKNNSNLNKKSSKKR